MKKTLLATSLAAAMLAAVPTQADTLGFEVGAALWQADLDGSYLDKGDNVIIYGAFEHPIPVLPNIRIQQNNVENEKGDYTYDTSFTDFLLYYEVLDNVVELDLGFGARKYHGEDKGTVHADIDPTLAAAYGRAQFNLPVTGLSLGLAATLAADSDSDATDIDAYVRWESGIGLGVSGGYRTLDSALIIGNDKDTTDVKLDGAYISAFYHF